MTEQSQRTQLGLYGKVIAAHQQATFSQLQRKAFWHLVEKKSWFHLFLLLLSSVMHIGIVFYLLIDLLYHALEEIYTVSFSIIISLTIISAAFAFLFRYILAKSLWSYFDIVGDKYGPLIKSFGGNWEFYCYLLFRDELKQWGFRIEDVEKVKPLFYVEQQTLGSYVAQKPFTVWVYTTLGAILAASASNWPLKHVVVVTVLGVLALSILHISPMFITNQRRQYELHRFLAWYQADL